MVHIFLRMSNSRIDPSASDMDTSYAALIAVSLGQAKSFSPVD
jgi:hypothetical protein